jgi:hypothetical protein
MKNKSKVKKPYKKPRIEKVRLVVEEALLVGCKITQIGGPGGANNCNKAGGCLTIGS